MEKNVKGRAMSERNIDILLAELEPVELEKQKRELDIEENEKELSNKDEGVHEKPSIIGFNYDKERARENYKHNIKHHKSDRDKKTIGAYSREKINVLKKGRFDILSHIHNNVTNRCFITDSYVESVADVDSVKKIG